MAGIGFELRHLGRREGLIAPLASVGHAAFIAAGPWIFTVVSMIAVHQATPDAMRLTVYAFRAMVIYAFALSLVATAPVVNVAIRLVADDIFLGRFHRIWPRFLASLAASMALSAAVALVVFGALFHLPVRDCVTAVAATTVVGGIWPSLGLCGAIRSYRVVSWAFVVGLAASVTLTIWAAAHGADAGTLLAAFTLGLGIIQYTLIGSLLATFPHPVRDLLDEFASLARGLRRYPALALGTTMSVLALWIDKWLMWFGPIGQRTDNGLANAPLYDGAMFVAYLAIIPALALFLTMVETTFFEAYRAFFAAIRGQETLAQIRRRADILKTRTSGALVRILMVQAVLCGLMAIGAPALVEAIGLQYQQIGILRLGAIAALFQFLFLASSSLLVFFDQHLRFALLQALFLVLQISATEASIRLGPSFYGFGHLIACAAAGLAALIVLERTFRHLDYLTFRSAWRHAAEGPQTERHPTDKIAPATGTTTP
jgi:uncharacterized membrane protein